MKIIKWVILILILFIVLIIKIIINILRKNTNVINKSEKSI